MFTIIIFYEVHAFVFSYAVYPSDVTLTLITSGDIISGQNVTFRCVTENFHLDTTFEEMRWKIGNGHDENQLTTYDDRGFTPTNGNNGEISVSSTYTFTAGSQHNRKYVTCVPRWESGVKEDLKRSQQITVNCKNVCYNVCHLMSMVMLCQAFGLFSFLISYT